VSAKKVAYQESEARHQSKMEARNGKEVPNPCVIEQLSEISTQSIAFPQQERAVKTSKIRGEPTVYESPNSGAAGIEEIVPISLRFIQGHQIHITSHITPEPDSLIGKILSIIECPRVVEVPYGSNSDSAGQHLPHWPLPLTIPDVKEQIA
jgi:hypothetical protein